MDIAVFAVLAAIAVGAGVLVFVVDSMARATFALAVSFIAVGAELLLLHAGYLGVITILMMVMEMSIMVVFMLMFMMNPAGLMPMSMLHNKRGSLAISIGTFIALALGAIVVPWPDRRGQAPTDVTRALGDTIMGPKMLTMIAVSTVLFATMISALTLASSRGRYDRPRPHRVNGSAARDTTRSSGRPASAAESTPGTVPTHRHDRGGLG